MPVSEAQHRFNNAKTVFIMFVLYVFIHWISITVPIPEALRIMHACTEGAQQNI